MNTLTQFTNKISWRSILLVCFAICVPLIIAIYALGVYQSGQENFATLILRQDISPRKASEIQAQIANQISVARADLLSSEDAAKFLSEKSKVNVSSLGVSVTSLPSRIRIVPQVGFTFEHVAADIQEVVLRPEVSTFVIPEKHVYAFAPASLAILVSILLFLFILPLVWFSLASELRLKSEENRRKLQLLSIFGHPKSKIYSAEISRGFKEGLTIGVYSTVLLLVVMISAHSLFPGLGLGFRGSMFIWLLVISPLVISPLLATSARRHVLKELL